MKYEKSKVKGRQLPDDIDAKKFLGKVVKNWPIILLAGIIGIGMGYVYSKLHKPSYASTTTLLIAADSKSDALSSIFNQQGPAGLGGNSDLYSQVEVLQSYSLNLKTLQYLNWTKSLYEKSFFGSTDLYLNEPLLIDVDNYNLQTKMVPVHITTLGTDEVEISVQENVVSDGIKHTIDIREKVKYGELFSNNYFSFSVKKINGATIKPNSEYILVFNSFEKLASKYIGNLKVELTDEDSHTIRLSLESNMPLRDVNYLNELVKVYIDFGLQEKNMVNDNALRFINNQIVGISDSLKSASKDFTNFRSKNKIVDLGQEATSIVNSLEEIETQEASTRMKMEYYDNLERYLNDARQMKDMVSPSVVGITDASLNSLVVKLSELYTQREVLSYSVQDKNPNLIALDNEIQYTKKLLIENIQNLVKNNNAELNVLMLRKQKVNSQLTKLPQTEQNLVEIKRGFDLNTELYTFLTRKRAEIGIAKASSNPTARVLDISRVNYDNPIGPGLFQVLMMGFLAGVSIPVAWFLFFSMVVKKLETIEDVEILSNLSIAGKIQINKFKTELPVVQFPKSSVTESFRKLRTNLYSLTNGEKQKVFAVHSSLIGEGKSFTSANLASVFALNNERVLLVECDLRKAKLKSVFGITKENGLSSFLMKKSSFDEVVTQTPVKGLSFVPAGVTPLYTSELLSNGMFEKFISIAKSNFDFIIIDSVPTEILSDAAIIAQYADVNLYLLRLKVSKKEQLDSAHRLSEEETIPKMVLVVNGTSPTVSKKKLMEYGYS